MKPTSAPRPIAIAAHTTKGATWRARSGTTRTASLNSAIAKEAIWDSAKRVPIRVVMPVELPTTAEAAIRDTMLGGNRRRQSGSFETTKRCSDRQSRWFPFLSQYLYVRNIPLGQTDLRPKT